jgi:hypothetical protein
MNHIRIAAIALIMMIFSSLCVAAQPKFLLMPTSPIHMQLAINQTATVQYRVINQTEVARLLTIQPIKNITQVTSGAGVCQNPFALAPHASCLLTLLVNSVSEPEFIAGGPVVCKTQSNTDTSPDPFLCSKPQTKNQLLITRYLPASSNRLTISPNSLTLTSGAPNTPGYITVTNNSGTLTASNIQGNLTGTALQGNVTQDASNCVSVAPYQSCRLKFTPANTVVALTNFPIQGTNTSAVGGSIQIKNPTTADLTVSGSPLVLVAGGQGTMMVRNTSSSITAQNVAAVLPSALTSIGVTVSPASCNIAPTGTCTLTFTATSTSATVSNTAIKIQGTNTQLIGASVAVTAPISFSVSGSPLTLLADGTTTGTMTITNNSSQTAANVQADFSQTALYGNVTATSCSSIAPTSSCVMTFTPAYNTVPLTTFSITTTSQPSLSTTAQLAIDLPSFAYVSNNSTSSPLMSTCNINQGETSLSNCARTEINSGLLNAPQGMTSNTLNNYFYIANSQLLSSSNYFSVLKCTLDQSIGALNNCAVLEDPNFYYPSDIALNTSLPVAYVASNSLNLAVVPAASVVSQCPVNSDGSFGGCIAIGGFNSPGGIALNQNNTMAYIASSTSGLIYQCTIDSQGNLQAPCVSTVLPAGTQPTGIVVDPPQKNVYFVDFNNIGIFQCPINSSTGYLTGCTYVQRVSYRPGGIAINSSNTMLYVTNYASPTYSCPITTVGDQSSVGSCTMLSEPNNQYGIALLND